MTAPTREAENYHFPLASRPPSRITENTAEKNRSVSQIGLNTHNQDHEISPVTFSRTKIIVKAMIGSLPDRLFLFSVCIIIPPNLRNHFTAICRTGGTPQGSSLALCHLHGGGREGKFAPGVFHGLHNQQVQAVALLQIVGVGQGGQVDAHQNI